ncbi:MAG TPA: hypothetical protein PK129_11085 [Cellvibrionaceae bacterium]|nr:hypothetical protein [Cellvibrionaceae bacterium]
MAKKSSFTPCKLGNCSRIAQPSPSMQSSDFFAKLPCHTVTAKVFQQAAKTLLGCK